MQEPSLNLKGEGDVRLLVSATVMCPMSANLGIWGAAILSDLNGVIQRRNGARF
jgi:hypothetical protein